MVVMNCGDSSALLGTIRPPTADGSATSTVSVLAAGLAMTATATTTPGSLGREIAVGTIPDGLANIKQGRHSRTISRFTEGGSAGVNRPRSRSPELKKPKFRLKFLTREHKPSNAKERRRIEAAGGVVYRMEGMMYVCRT